MSDPPLSLSVASCIACLVHLHERLQALLVLLHWQMRGSIARELRRIRPGPASLLGHALAALLSTGCASLPPPDAARARSTVLGDVAHTRLAQVARASAAGVDPALSGFRLLADGDQALDARIALVRRAQVSLDIQYYLVAADATGRRFLRELGEAAGRGVRVRLLVDDLYANDSRLLLAGLAAQANVEVRLFNPLPQRGGKVGTRVALSLHEFERINRRMHNKLFIADGSLAVIGGRNIADDYFKRGEPSNFIDMDVLCSGPVVNGLGAVFDRFWNSEQAWPVQALLPDTDDGARAYAQVLQSVRGDPPVAPLDRLGYRPVTAELDEGRLTQHFAPARLYADGPEKAATEGRPAPEAFALEGALQAMREARSQVLVATPYLVPGERGLALMRRARDKGLRVIVMTNAQAATDEPLVHWGYARYRAEMVAMGVELHELSPALGRRADAAAGESASSLGRLHAKLAVIDGRRLLIGSMNMDRRSMRANTELGVLIDSPALAVEVTQTLQRDRDVGSYRLRSAARRPGSLEWVAQEAGREVVHPREPGVSWAERLRLGLMSLFVAEELL
ncbi:Cardiolipin synthase [Variovorax sp. PBL-H6]|uniref:phospholipase D-like domain-containing protein n=1 Tax=Variovorax sp. PBL-H6 TaxID=434009 RepID=UPI0013169FB6|nr:phosphatidylserine/phosphatidylglycerophosphate/cardiolipin synthase family protein [Variovorax sp. PBL-H6]VTU22162.1 Cardiolipin synthase [Variovorax sp. PBL-H6]